MNAQENTYEEVIPTKAKVAYGSASSAHLFLSGIGLGSINIFYLKVLGASPSSLIFSWILFIAWNMINDPLIGILQDKTKTRWGRRIPYLRFGAPIYALTFIWIWFPFISEEGLLFLNHLFMLFIFDTIYSAMGLIFYSMPAEMALTTKERGSIMIYTTALGAIGTLGTIIIPLIYLTDVPDVEGFRLMMVIFGLLAGFVIFLASYHIKENQYTQLEDSLGFIDSIKESLKNKPFLIAEVAIFASVIMQNVIVPNFIFLFDYVVDFNLSSVLNIILFLILFIIIGYTIFWLNTNIEKYGLKKLMIIGVLIAIGAFVLLLIMGLTLDINQTNKMPLFLMFLPLVGIGIGLIGFMLLSQPLMADCIDYDEVLTGKRRETTYSGVNALITKPAVSIGNALFLWIIAIYGYKTGVDDPMKQPSTVGTGVVIAFTLVPIVCLLIAVIALKWFPLDGEDWKKKKMELQEIHQKKERDYIEYVKKQGIIEDQKSNEDIKKKSTS